MTLGPAYREDFLRACDYFLPLRRDGRPVRIIWNDGDNIQSSYKEIEEAGLSAGPHGKGRNARLVIVVGSKKALGIAVKNDKTQKRFTWLDARLRR